MSNGRGETPELHVEGEDDQHTITHLLKRDGVDMDEGNRPFEIKTAAGVEKLLNTIRPAVLAARKRPVGFVLDTDVSIQKRWAQVRDRLREAFVKVPVSCPSEGFIGQKTGYEHPVGVWLMPDCATDFGMLEHLVASLVPSGDELWSHATKCTDEAQALVEDSSKPDLLKAQIHCWLAWQHEPGLPFGTAIKAKFFGQSSPQADAFLGWLKKLYSIL